MRCPSLPLVRSFIALVAVSCGDDAPDEGGRPDTFGDECMLGGLDTCLEPFVCLELPNFSPTASAESICTQTCQQTTDCPAWQETGGSCSGAAQSECVRLICRDACR